MMFDLTGKTVVVTGGGRGIGRGIARAMAMAGADIVISGRSLRPLEETATELRALGVHVVVAPGDIMSHRGIADLVTAALALKGRGRIDCWVNNAGSATIASSAPGLARGQGLLVHVGREDELVVALGLLLRGQSSERCALGCAAK